MGRRKTAGAIGGSALVGAGVSRWDLVEKIVDALIRVLDEHGPAVGISTIFVVATIALCWRLLNVALKAKDDEIKRLVKLRDELWELHVSALPRSGYTEPAPRKAARKPSRREEKRDE